MLNLGRRKDRCKKCGKERALRLCARRNQGLCWKCCNQLRIDRKCPPSCPYAPKIETDNSFPAFKADNNSEYNQINRAYIDVWINKPIESWDGKSPMQLKNADQEALLKKLSEYQYPGNFPVGYLMDRLGLQSDHQEDATNADDVVAAYLNDVIALEYDKLIEYTMNDTDLPLLKDRYAEIAVNNPYFKKLKQYSFIHSGLSKDGAQAVVFVELNLRDEYTFILRYEDKRWYIRQNIAGNPSLYFKQNERYQVMAELLSQNNHEQAFYEIAEALRSYPDSADLYYYRALYWGMINDNKKAKEDLITSIALDNYFSSPYMNLGLLYLIEKEYDQAQMWFEMLSKIEPENLDAINNLAITHLAKEEKEKALEIWRELNQKHPAYQLAKQNLELYG